MTPIHPRDVGLPLARQIKPRGRKQGKAASTPEAVTQALTEQYLDRLGLPWLHFPAYLLRAAFGWQNTPTGAQLGAMRAAAEAVRGFPDLLVMDAQTGRYIALELKTPSGKLTAAQRLWRSAIGTQEARSFEQAREIIDRWMGAPKAEGPEGAPPEGPKPTP